MSWEVLALGNMNQYSFCFHIAIEHFENRPTAEMRYIAQGSLERNLFVSH